MREQSEGNSLEQNSIELGRTTANDCQTDNLKEPDIKKKAKSKGNKQKKKGGQRKRKRTVKDDLIDLLLRIGLIIIVVWAIFTFVFGIFVNSGIGMEPSIQDRDIVVFYRLDNDYTANEAVVYEVNGKKHIGRIAAAGGDTVEIDGQGLKVNGYAQQDYKNEGDTLAAKGGPTYPLKLKSDEVFILGDNRENTVDSRMYGPIKLKNVKGSALTLIRRRDI